jgi:hypothetical protein
MPLQSKEVLTFFMHIRTREECGCSLAAEVLEQSGTVRVRVSGSSMLPTLWPGDTLTIQSQAFAETQVGEIVLCEREGRFFVHRLVSVCAGGEALLTRGDCVPECDAPVPATSFLGVVVLVHRGNSLIVPNRRASVCNRVAAFYLQHSVLAQNIVLRLHSFMQTRKARLPRLQAVRGAHE